MTELLELLRKLTDARGVTGDEAEVAALIADLCKDRSDRVETDALGNVLAFKKGKSSARTVLVDSHMDEVGLYVNHIGDEGLIKCTTLGIDPRVINGRRVLVGEKRVKGVLGTKPIHLQSTEERASAPALERLYIDIGAKDAAEAKRHVRIGDTVIFDSAFVEFGEDCVKARALDNRLGCAIVLEAMKQQPAYDTWYVFSVLEESGGHGARVATMKIQPDFAIVIDTTTAADHLEKPVEARASLPGKGSVIFLMESTTYYNPESVRKVVAIANEAGVRWQHKTVTAGGLDSGSIQRTGYGVETVAIATPCRYIHSASCTVRKCDMKETLGLMTALLSSEKI